MITTAQRPGRKGRTPRARLIKKKNRQKAQIISIVNEIGDVNTDYAYI